MSVSLTRGDAIPITLMTKCLLSDQCSLNANMAQMERQPHFQKLRWRVVNPSSKSPCFCIEKAAFSRSFLAADYAVLLSRAVVAISHCRMYH